MRADVVDDEVVGVAASALSAALNSVEVETPWWRRWRRRYVFWPDEFAAEARAVVAAVAPVIESRVQPEVRYVPTRQPPCDACLDGRHSECSGGCRWCCEANDAGRSGAQVAVLSEVEGLCLARADQERARARANGLPPERASAAERGWEASARLVAHMRTAIEARGREGKA